MRGNKEARGEGGLIVRGRLRTQDPENPWAEAMVVHDGVLTYVGSWDDLPDAASGLPVHEVRGIGLPGLIDSHLHTFEVGIERSRLVISEVASVADVVELVREWVRSHPDAEWITASAHFQLDDLREGRLPDRHDLDAVSDGRPVYLDLRTHDAIVNSEALRGAGITRDTEDPPGGSIGRDADGDPTGHLVERPAADLVFALVPPHGTADLRRALAEAQRHLHAFGIVGGSDPGVSPAQLSVYEAARAEGWLTLRTMAMPLALTDLPVDEFVARLAGYGPTGKGDDRLKVGPVKVYLDGTGSFGTAMTFDPWPGSDDYLGHQVCSTESLRDLMRFCAAEGWSVAIHTVGPRAVRVALDCMEEIDRQRPIAPLRFSVMHAYMWPAAEDIRRAARLGVLISLQPSLHWRVGALMAERFGDVPRFAPVRDWIDAGATLAGGSDGPDFPISPFFGMWQARSRRVRARDEPLGVAHALTPQEALDLYTTSAARYCFAEQTRGSLQAGKVADWIEVSADPLEIADDALLDIEVHRTVVAGAVVHDAAAAT